MVYFILKYKENLSSYPTSYFVVKYNSSSIKDDMVINLYKSDSNLEKLLKLCDGVFDDFKENLSVPNKEEFEDIKNHYSLFKNNLHVLSIDLFKNYLK
ncbi:hypothetical protein K9L67_04345 [Candidatus Woesearchaeota archaeon]|nr:hypothetical protein [Candidatus Woesearchaeota archaeon]MCF8013025.1 hypothetical protein [Candidatus Woesearchaeota archaeon]